MTLQNITIENLGAIEHFSYYFEEGLNALRTRYSDDLALAIRIVLNHKDIPPLPRDAVRADSQITATIFMEPKKYKIIVLMKVTNIESPFISFVKVYRILLSLKQMINLVIFL